MLFADLKGSMELLADRDPEGARMLLDPVLEHMMEAVHRYEGTVNQVMGDGNHGSFWRPTRPRRSRHPCLLCCPSNAGGCEVRGEVWPKAASYLRQAGRRPRCAQPTGRR